MFGFDAAVGIEENLHDLVPIENCNQLLLIGSLSRDISGAPIAVERTDQALDPVRLVLVDAFRNHEEKLHPARASRQQRANDARRIARQNARRRLDLEVPYRRLDGLT